MNNYPSRWVFDSADDIVAVLGTYLGHDQWHRYFYPEFVDSLTPGTAAYNYMCSCKYEKGYTQEELNNEDTYGYWVNLADWNPGFPNLHRYFGSDCKPIVLRRKYQQQIKQGRKVKNMILWSPFWRETKRKRRLNKVK